MNTTRVILVTLLAGILVMPAGCVKRSIGVRSDPPGALVYLDGLEVGQTPVDHISFDFYGTREIALYREGYLAEKRVVEIDTPWYSWFPVDIVTELVIPWDIHDRRYYYFDLRRTEPIEQAALMRHAHDTREVARTRIEGARSRADYMPRAYAVKDAEKPFFLWGWLFVPPRGEPVYLGDEPETESEQEE